MACKECAVTVPFRQDDMLLQWLCCWEERPILMHHYRLQSKALRSHTMASKPLIVLRVVWND